MTSRLYVFAPIRAGGMLSSDHRLAGRIDWEDGTGTFLYAPEWLDAADTVAYPLDPINLPLREGPTTTRVNGGVHGVLADAGPDAWGTKLLELHRGAAADTPLDTLRVTNGSGTGALLFSGSRTRPAPRRHLVAEASLEELERAAFEVDAGETVQREDLELVYRAGSSLGGARPKVAVADEGRVWLAKLEAKADDINIPQLEAACLTLARDAGLEVPDHRLVDLNGRKALLVARFDRPDTGTLHYLSLHALLSAERLSAADVRAPLGSCTYGGLATRCRRIGVADAGSTLFHRMLFNLRVGNTDDHLRNHGLLFDGTDWRHAPTFDVVALGGQLQAIGMGTQGRAATLDNAFSDVERFGLTLGEARALDDQVRGALAGAEQRLIEAGLPPADVGRALGRMQRD